MMLSRYIFGLICAALIAGILQSLLREGGCARVLKLLCGVFFLVTALKPLLRLEIPDLSQWISVWEEEGEAAVQEGEDSFSQAYSDGIRTRLEAYILDKAAQLGLSVEVGLTLSPEGLPEAAVLSGEGTEAEKERLMTILATDLGIPKEKLQWKESYSASEIS